MSIRLRLSLLFSAILALTLVIAGIVLYTTQSQYTLNWLKQDLMVSSDTLAQSILQNSTSPKPPDAAAQPGSPPPSGNQPPNGGPLQSASPPAQLTLPQDQVFQQRSQQEIVRVLDPDGVLIASPYGSTSSASANSSPGSSTVAAEKALPISAAGLQAVRARQDWWSTETVSGVPLLIYSRPVISQGRVIAVLQMARALTERDNSLQVLARMLVIDTLVALLVAFAVIWFLAREALRPIRRISETARAIGAEHDFSRRVEYDGPPDEVGVLAQTFNAMLARLEDAYQKTARALDLQRSFVADVSHELRTPLTTLRGNLGLLGHAPALPSEDQADILNDMVEESDRLVRLVNDLLVLARAEASPRLAHAPVELRPLVEEACRQARRLDANRPINLAVPEGLSVLGDRDALKQVLLILLDNALKHSQGAITLSASPAGSQAQVLVHDSGQGIPPEDLPHVFDRFYRGEDRLHTPGLGLGLPIAKALVEGMSGGIAIDSPPGEGCNLVIHLPASS
jgi:two-component system, OmpR family, sensor kinase